MVGPRQSKQATARIVGVLFIIGTAAGILSGIFTAPIFGSADYLGEVSSQETSIIVGALLVLLMGFALAMIPVLLFPIFKKHNEVLALGAVVFRGVLEAVCYILIVIGWTLLISLSQEYVASGSADMQTMGVLIVAAGDWVNAILAMVFSLGALMIYWLFYRTKLIPGWLALWGLVGALLYLAAPVINLFDPAHPVLSLGGGVGLLMAPLALQEMILALWLIVKGFNASAMVLGEAGA